MGVEVVAVFSKADRDAPYLALADRAICIGDAPSADSYLNVPRLIAAAEVADVQAIHPGYGFLSENPHFAEVCRTSKFVFIGPPHEAIRKMGLKTEAKAVAAAARVPCVPGSDGPVDTDADALRFARSIGYPVLIKAAAGGGGKGMRVCTSEASLSASLQAARNEAEAAFKNPSVYLEKFIDRPKHVEVQILADAHGNVLHCWERDCSLQRRHQKLVEESPAVSLPLKVRKQASARPPSASPRAPATSTPAPASSSSTPTTTSTSSRSTPASRSSTPVSEMVTNIDLVKQQIRIAAGEPLAFTQADVQPRWATPSSAGSTPKTPTTTSAPRRGLITGLRVPGGRGVRWDSHIQVGYRVPPNYDSMIGKLIVHGTNRADAISHHATGPRRAGHRRAPHHPAAAPPHLPQP